MGWSFVYILKSIGARTLPCGRPFFWFLHLLLPSIFFSTYVLDNLCVLYMTSSRQRVYGALGCDAIQLVPWVRLSTNV
jgi:hypothetical protein